MRSILLCLPLCFSAANRAEEASTITSVELESHVRFLASDALQGRLTGSDEAMLAAGYLAASLQRAGLQGAGDDGGFLQAVPLYKIEALGTPLVSGSSKGRSAATEFAHGEHFSIYKAPASKSGSLRIVHVPEGAELPEPDASIALDFAGSRSDARKRLEAADRADGQGYGLILLRGSSTDGKPRGPIREGNISRGVPDAGASPAWLVVRGSLLEALESQQIESIEYDGACELQPVPASNVVARIPGVGTPERPELADQVVVLSAHYDHLGVMALGDSNDDKSADRRDRIFNGADDDASGVACVLEVARILAAGSPPAREVVILLATGEEQGLLGTEHYLDHPAASLERTVANLNVEMIGRPDAKVGGAGQLWFTGCDETNLLVEFNAASVGVSRDPYPEMNFYRRSDNYAFVKRGVIGQTFSTYDLHTDYHKVSDDADSLDYDHLAGASNLVLRAVRLVTSGDLDPSWAEGKGPAAPR